MPLVYMLLFLPMTSAIGRFIVGAGIATATYYVLTSLIRPIMGVLESRILELSASLGSSIPVIAQAIQFIDLLGLCVIILSAYSASMSIKILSISFKAFGVNT